jgi:hypothetical protein
LLDELYLPCVAGLAWAPGLARIAVRTVGGLGRFGIPGAEAARSPIAPEASLATLTRLAAANGNVAHQPRGDVLDEVHDQLAAGAAVAAIPAVPAVAAATALTSVARPVGVRSVLAPSTAVSTRAPVAAVGPRLSVLATAGAHLHVDRPDQLIQIDQPRRPCRTGRACCPC